MTPEAERWPECTGRHGHLIPGGSPPSHTVGVRPGSHGPGRGQHGAWVWGWKEQAVHWGPRKRGGCRGGSAKQPPLFLKVVPVPSVRPVKRKPP